MKIHMGFNPESLDTESSLRRLFKIKGVALKFWCLYKRDHIVDENFTNSCLDFAELLDQITDGFSDREIYTNPYEFKTFLVISECQIPRDEWILMHWDYFNLNIQKNLEIEYQIIEPVKKVILV